MYSMYEVWQTQKNETGGRCLHQMRRQTSLLGVSILQIEKLLFQRPRKMYRLRSASWGIAPGSRAYVRRGRSTSTSRLDRTHGIYSTTRSRHNTPDIRRN